tara:strand:- start:231 stop:527 length:297 start_codon:yes stop_codon:yes gene_type:complete
MNDTYDAGYLPNDEDCDQDSIRVELAYSHDFYSSIIESKDEQIAELKKDISIAAKIMIDITNAQTVTDEGYSVGYLVTNKMMNGLDAFISKALEEQGE